MGIIIWFIAVLMARHGRCTGTYSRLAKHVSLGRALFYTTCQIGYTCTRCQGGWRPCQAAVMIHRGFFFHKRHNCDWYPRACGGYGAEGCFSAWILCRTKNTSTAMLHWSLKCSNYWSMKFYSRLHLWPLLLKWINLNPGMFKWSHPC